MPLPDNPNLKRRPVLGFATRVAALLLRLPLRLLRAPRKDAPLTVFQCYMVGDFFMALPAIRRLAAAFPIRVVCRPDCEPFLRELGIPAIPFRNAFFLERSAGSFFRTWPAAWRLRAEIGGTVAVDFDADPRTGFWLRVAGAWHVMSYARAHAGFFDELLPLSGACTHQADRDDTLAQAVIAKLSPSLPTDVEPLREPAAPEAPWIVSCWTRRDVKNWPLAAWDVFLEDLSRQEVPFQVLDAPDADPEFARFRERWSARAPFLKAPLPGIAEAVRRSAGVIGTDNFLGHMAAYYGKPVLWINGSSDPAHVMPKGPDTRRVQVEPMPCRPCNHRCVNPRYKACLNTLTPEEVGQAFRELRVRTTLSYQPSAA